MNRADDPVEADRERRVHAWMLGLVAVALVAVLLPFYGPIMWGAIIGLMFAPLYRRLLRRMPARRNVAALLTLMVVLLIVVLPFGAVVAGLAAEAARVYEQIQTGAWNPAQMMRQMVDALPGWATGLLERLGLVDFAALQRRVSAAFAQGSQFIARQALNIGQNTFELVIDLFVALYLAFFLVRDGDAIAHAVRRTIPLSPRHKAQLIGNFTTVVRATVRGNLVVAAVQGALGGLAFWFLGVRGALLWAVLMAFLSLLPAVGAVLVWLPVALYFLVSGQVWQGLALIGWGVVVIGLVDNVLRVVLVGKDTRMPDYVVMITTLGGMALLGLNGFVVGPTVAAVFIAVWHMHVGPHDGARPVQ